jgi:cation diffusion facilitator CzcD-associated flavoprotein CzcO
VVTIVPELAVDAEHVTMLQRAPTYIAALPNHDKMAAKLKRLFPRKNSFHRLICTKKYPCTPLYNLAYYPEAAHENAQRHRQLSVTV